MFPYTYWWATARWNSVKHYKLTNNKFWIANRADDYFRMIPSLEWMKTASVLTILASKHLSCFQLHVSSWESFLPVKKNKIWCYNPTTSKYNIIIEYSKSKDKLPVTWKTDQHSRDYTRTTVNSKRGIRKLSAKMILGSSNVLWVERLTIQQ